MAVSTDGKEMVQNIPDSCKAFFDQDFTPLSDKELARRLEAMELRQNVNYGHGTVQAILAGILLYNAPGQPSNLSIKPFLGPCISK